MQLRKSSLIVLFLCLACGCITASAQSISFAAPSFIPNGTAQVPPFCEGCLITTGDLNGDGKLDIAMFGSGVFVLLGNGDGTFQPAVTVNIPGWSATNSNQGFAVGDFNGDGILDLLALMPNSGGGYRLSVLLGNGDATFQVPVSTFVATGYDGGPLLTGHFNKGKHLDVAIADPTGVQVFSGYGDGTFLTPGYFIPILNASSGLATADFDANGKDDIFAGMYVTLSTGRHGTFTPPVRVTNATNVGAENWGDGRAVVADFDGDGKLDLAVWRGNDSPYYNGGYYDSDVTIVFGNGDGTFRPLSPQIGMPIVLMGPILGAGDFNLDGKSEALATCAHYCGIWGGAVSAGGTLGLVTYFDFSEDVPKQLEVGDFNGDNSPDLAVPFINEDVGGTSTRLLEGIAIFLNMRGTYVSITTSGSPCDDDRPVVLTATVTPSVNKNVIPTGTVAITEGHKRIGTAQLSAAGQATFTLKHLGLGTHDITAYYLGDNNFNPNWSPTVRQRVRKTEKGKH